MYFFTFFPDTIRKINKVVFFFWLGKGAKKQVIPHLYLKTFSLTLKIT